MKKTFLEKPRCSWEPSPWWKGEYLLWMAAAAGPELGVQEIQQQQKKVSGTVSDAMGPIIGASVMEKGTSNGAITDFNGNFSLNVRPAPRSSSPTLAMSSRRCCGVAEHH